MGGAPGLEELKIEPMEFPRGPGPLVSVLLPTRGRPGWLAQSVDSLFSLAKEKNWLEFLFRADSDDTDTIQLCSKMVALLPNSKLLVAERGWGFKGMHFMINDLSAMARGDWLLIWNDDCLMRTQDWDWILAYSRAPSWHGCPDVFMLNLPSLGRPDCNEFMFLRREVTRILGHWSLSPHNDNWIHRVMSAINCVAVCPFIGVEHFSDKIGDLTRQESEAAYRETSYSLNGPTALRALLYDSWKLLDYLDAYEKGG